MAGTIRGYVTQKQSYDKQQRKTSNCRNAKNVCR